MDEVCNCNIGTGDQHSPKCSIWNAATHCAECGSTRDTVQRDAELAGIQPVTDAYCCETLIEEKPRLFIGVHACGLAYCDRWIEVNGDYKRIAFLPYSSLELEIADPASPLIDVVKADAAAMQARRGQQFPVSASGQTVTLGGKHAAEN